MSNEPRKPDDNVSERLRRQDKDDRTKRDQKTSRQSRNSERESASRRNTKTSKERKATNSSEPSVRNAQHHTGYATTVPKEWLHTINVDIPREAGKPLLIDVTKQMLVRKYDGGASELEYGDFIRAVNGRKVNTRHEFVAILEELKCPPDPHTAVLTVVRPRKKIVIPESDKLEALPNAGEKLPGFDYFHVGLVLSPGARLGVSVRSYKSKVYVTNTDNGWSCIARRSLLMGDALLTVGDTYVNSVESFKEVVMNAFAAEKRALLLVERAANQTAVKQVKAALLADKVPQYNPAISSDVWAIASRQIEWMKAHPGEEPACNILKEDQPGFGPAGPSVERHATLSPMSQQVAIGTESVHPGLLVAVPPSPSAHTYAKLKK